jgi:putative addiction module component (TIGR02574 family)
MSPNFAAVLAAAESLPVPERYELIDRLLQGLDDLANGGVEGPIPALSPAWRQEIARRSAEYDAGRAETVSWQGVKTRWQIRGADD